MIKYKAILTVLFVLLAMLGLCACAGARFLVPGPASVEAGLLGGQVAALAGAQLGPELLAGRTVAGGQLAGACALGMLLHLDAGALFLAEARVDAAAGHDDGNGALDGPGGDAGLTKLVAGAVTLLQHDVGRGHLKIHTK
jgi:hypothetical protein